MRVSQKVMAVCALCWLAGSAGVARADAGSPDESVAATAVSVTGDVRLQAGDAWQTVQEGQLFSSGDRVVTGENSALQMVLADGSSVALGADSELSLDNIGSGAEGSVTLLSLAKGLLDTMVQKLKLGSRFEVQTPYAVAAVKGTDFEVSDADSGSAVTVNEGTVQFGDAGRSHFEPVQPMQRGQILQNRLIAARPLSLAERGVFQRRWARARFLHLHRRDLLNRIRRSPMHRRFLRQLRARRAFRSRMGARRGRGRMGMERRGALRRGGNRWSRGRQGQGQEHRRRQDN